MRVVLDTNTMISAFLWGGIPWLVYFAAYRQQKYTIVVSEALISELRRVLSRSKFGDRLKSLNTTVESVMADYAQAAETVTPADIPPDAVRAPKDVAVLACAVGGRANVIVSGDRDLLDLGS
jgi:putative PIN family toxin of toxin-antitoxin system